jgi:hypothetical protein
VCHPPIEVVLLSESYDIQTHFFPCCFFATGDSLYLSGTEFDLQPLASEYYGDRAGTNYYSVALVPAAFCASNPAPTLASLKVSCCCCCYPPPFPASTTAAELHWCLHLPRPQGPDPAAVSRKFAVSPRSGRAGLRSLALSGPTLLSNVVTGTA